MKNGRKAKVVFALKGCFDILHKGHEVPSEEKALRDIWIVAVNSDDSVKRLNSPQSPVNDEASRAYLIAALEFADVVAVLMRILPNYQ